MKDDEYLMKFKDKKSSFFYGWIIIALAFLAMAMNNAVHFSFPLFFVPILEEFSWTRADTALIFSINIIFYGIAAPLIGVAIDRYGPRLIMAAGALLLALATASMCFASEIWHFYFLFGILAAFGICATGAVPSTTLAARWFYKRRSTIIGIILLGIGVGYVFVSISAVFIENYGWRNTFLFLSLIPLISAPLFALFVRGFPSEKGLKPFGVDEKDSPADNKTNNKDIIDPIWVNTEWTLKRAIKTSRFWFLFLCGFCYWGFAGNLIRAHQILFVTDQGYSLTFATLIFSLYGVFYGGGNLFGFLSDRYGREKIATFGMILSIISIFFLISNRGNSTPYLLYIYSLLMGTGAGIAAPAFMASTADLFQGKHFGSINGFIMLGFSTGGALSPWLGGKIYDLVNSYLPSFILVIISLGAAILFIWLAAPRKVRMNRSE